MEMSVAKRSHKIPMNILILYAMSVLAVGLCAGCGTERGVLFPPLDSPLVWPGPPEKPRIRYIGALSTELDLKKEVSWSQSIVETIFGKDKTGILVGPYAVAIDKDNRLFVADTMASVIHLFDLESRLYKQFNELKGDEQLQIPVALAVIGRDIYVVDSALRKVCVFDRDGEFRFSFGREHFKRPCGIAYSSGEEKIYISDSATHKINVFSVNGEFIDTIGSRGAKPGLFNFPTHLWVDGSGDLYVSDTLNYRIQVFNSDGAFVKLFGKQGDRPGNFAHPAGVATDNFGHIYVADKQFENIQIFNSEGELLMAWGQEGSGIGQFWLPAGVFIDSQNRIYVADPYNKRIQIFGLLEEVNDAN